MCPRRRPSATFVRMTIGPAALALALGAALPPAITTHFDSTTSDAKDSTTSDSKKVAASAAVSPSERTNAPASAAPQAAGPSATNAVTGGTGAGANAADAARAASIVDAPVNEADYIKARSCIDLQSIRDVHAIDASHVVFAVRGHKYMLNQLRYPCTYLHNDNVLSVNVVGSSVCNLDRLDILERGSVDPREVIGMHRLGSCSLGKFEEITKAQLDAINESARTNHGKDFWKWVKGGK